METSRQRVLNAIGHIQPEVTPVNLMGFGGMERWLRHFGATDYVDLRLKMGLDLIDVRPVYIGPNAAQGLDIWGVPANWGGRKQRGYSRSRDGFPLAQATTIREIERYAWPDPDQFDYAVVGRELAALPADKAKWVRANYVAEQEGLSREQAARGSGSSWLPLLCTLFNLFGMEKTLMHIAAEPALIEAAVARIEDFTLEFCRRLLSACGAEVDIFWYGDDFAAQRDDHFATAVSPLSQTHLSKSLCPGEEPGFEGLGSCLRNVSTGIGRLDRRRHGRLGNRSGPPAGKRAAGDQTPLWQESDLFRGRQHAEDAAERDGRRGCAGVAIASPCWAKTAVISAAVTTPSCPTCPLRTSWP